MTTKNQLIANTNNAQLSTGATTLEGKAIVAKNAVKHGIFAKDLIIARGDGKENPADFANLLHSFVCDLNPVGQLQYTLVEKIVVDYWRMKRLLRFETGSICKKLDNAIDELRQQKNYSGKKIMRSDKEIMEDIEATQAKIDSYNKYAEGLRANKIDIERILSLYYSGNDADDDADDFIMMAKSDIRDLLIAFRDKNTTDDSDEPFDIDNLSVAKMRRILDKMGFDAEVMSGVFLCNAEEEICDLMDKLEALKHEIEIKSLMDESEIKYRSLPVTCDADKIIRYESSLQRSIFQNIVMLKKLQGIT